MCHRCDTPCWESLSRCNNIPSSLGGRGEGNPYLCQPWRGAESRWIRGTNWFVCLTAAVSQMGSFSFDVNFELIWSRSQWQSHRDCTGVQAKGGMWPTVERLGRLQKGFG